MKCAIIDIATSLPSPRRGIDERRCSDRRNAERVAMARGNPRIRIFRYLLESSPSESESRPRGIVVSAPAIVVNIKCRGIVVTRWLNRNRAIASSRSRRWPLRGLKSADVERNIVAFSECVESTTSVWDQRWPGAYISFCNQLSSIIFPSIFIQRQIGGRHFVRFRAFRRTGKILPHNHTLL